MRYIQMITWLITWCLLPTLQAQSPTTGKKLDLQAAINLALTNNHDLKIQHQSILLANNNITKANAGLLPIIDAVGMGSYTNNFSEVDLRTFQPEPPLLTINESGVETSTISLGVEANYVLWDGGQSKIRFQLLEGLSAVEQAKQAVLVNGVISGITELYFEIVKLQNQTNVLQESIALTRERIAKIEDRKTFGKANKLTLLQAETTLNQDLSVLDNIELIKSNLLMDLKNLMNDDTLNDIML